MSGREEVMTLADCNNCRHGKIQVDKISGEKIKWMTCKFSKEKKLIPAWTVVENCHNFLANIGFKIRIIFAMITNKYNYVDSGK
jgi:hypothetical protein